jgi:hypothetical protein
MNVLDEDIIKSQHEELQIWRIHFVRIGFEVGWRGMDDKNEIIPLLHRLRRSTFFTRDAGFYDRTLCHARYCIVHLRVEKDEVAEYIRRFLRHPEFNSSAKRLGKVVQVSPVGLRYWQLNMHEEQTADWPVRHRRA